MGAGVFFFFRKIFLSIRASVDRIYKNPSSFSLELTGARAFCLLKRQVFRIYIALTSISILNKCRKFRHSAHTHIQNRCTRGRRDRDARSEIKTEASFSLYIAYSLSLSQKPRPRGARTSATAGRRVYIHLYEESSGKKP